MPKLSVIVPVYNVEDYLHECINSILCQTMEDLELILIDDGSQDGCSSICDEYAEKDSRVKVIHQENRGVSAARNSGLRIASGEYIGFVDPDDWVSLNAYETLCSSAEAGQADIVVCGFIFCRQDGCVDYIQAVPAGTFSRDELILSIYGMPNRFHGSMCNKVFSKRILNGLQFDETVAIGEDWLLLYECYCQANKAIAVPESLYFVRMRSGSATRNENATLYANKVKTYYRLYKKANTQSKMLQRQAVVKILDVCATNKREIQKQSNNGKELRFVNRLLRRVSIRGFLRNNLSAKVAAYHFIEGLKK